MALLYFTMERLGCVLPVAAYGGVDSLHGDGQPAEQVVLHLPLLQAWAHSALGTSSLLTSWKLNKTHYLELLIKEDQTNARKCNESWIVQFRGFLGGPDRTAGSRSRQWCWWASGTYWIPPFPSTYRHLSSCFSNYLPFSNTAARYVPYIHLAT